MVPTLSAAAITGSITIFPAAFFSSASWRQLSDDARSSIRRSTREVTPCAAPPILKDEDHGSYIAERLLTGFFGPAGAAFGAQDTNLHF